ncbi:MAG: hypothetical protein DMF71_08070 [Acidobacteria bacterium]|nr:MAG: hypothetical protein DMF71_08070 [Acidobacteriota bacterium]
MTKPRAVAPWELGLIAATRGAIGFGAGLLIADKLKRDRRKVVGWSLFLTGLQKECTPLRDLDEE